MLLSNVFIVFHGGYCCFYLLVIEVFAVIVLLLAVIVMLAAPILVVINVIIGVIFVILSSTYAHKMHVQ